MAKTTIDPGFIGVPQFKRTTFDPVQFTQNMMAERKAKQAYETEAMRKKQQENIDFLRKQMGEVDIQAWEDKKGYEELSQRKQAIYAKAMDAARRGYNLYAPQTTEEMSMMREFQQNLNELSGDVDIWNIYKEKLKEWDKEAQRQMFLDPEEQTFDFEKYKEFREGMLQGEGNIQERARQLEMFDFGKPLPYTAQQMNKYMMEDIAATIPGMDQQVKEWKTDPKTGEIISTTWEGVDPKRIRTGLRQIYNRTGGKQREFLDQQFEQAMAGGYQGDLNDWLVETYAPQYAEQTTKKRIAGQKDRDMKAVQAARPPQVDGRYDLKDYATAKRYGTTTDGTTAVHTYESRATLPMTSIFKNRGYTIALTPNTVVKGTGERAPEAIAAGTIPMDISFIPTATENITITALNPETGKEETITVRQGERIPSFIQKEMDMENSKAGEMKYSYTIRPYVEANVYKSMMKDPQNPDRPWEVPAPNSEKMTTIRPYDESRMALMNFAAGLGVDFTEFDNDVRGIQQQLNKEIADENTMYQQLGL